MEVNITGARVLFRLPLGITITETQLNMWIIMAVIALLCKWLTRDLKVKPESKRQVVAELIVKTINNLVKDVMGVRFENFAPFVATLFAFLVFSNLSGLFGLFSPTADLNTTLGWAIVVFVMILRANIRSNGVKGYLKGLTEPVVFFTPLNVIGEFATPVSMAMRLFGNVLSGTVISTLIYAGLATLSSFVLQKLPGFLAGIPIFQLGIPAILSIYFDLFSGVLQAFIFCMLTMAYIANAASDE
jgi:F-type H+-transporting ATPase subunit a